MNDGLALMAWQNKESALNRRHLDGKDQRLSFFADGVRIDDDDVDRSEIVARLPCPFVLKVVPYTRYRLTFQSRMEFTDGATPTVHLHEWDLNSDATDNVCVCHVDKSGTGEWQEHRIDMQTGWNGHHLVPEVWTSKGGTARLTVKDFTLTQTSDNEGNRPRPIELLGVEDVVFEPGKSLGICALPYSERRFELDLGFVAEDFKGRCFLVMQWLDNGGTVLAEDRGEFASEPSIDQTGASLTLRWRRRYGQEADGVSLAMTRHVSKDDTRNVVGEQNRLFCGMPATARKVCLFTQADDVNQGRLTLARLRLRTY